MERWSIKLVREVPSADMASVYTTAGGPAEVAKIARYFLKEEAVEVLLAFFLNVKNEVIGWQEVSRGIVDSSLVHPREVFKAAILANASSVIIAHNHPSGDPTPSFQDREVSAALSKTGDLLGIRFLDHLVVTPDQWHSAL